MAEKKKNTIWNKLGVGMMAMGEGMTGRPFLSNYQKLQAEREQAKSEFEKWQEEQELKKQQLLAENQIAMMKQGYIPSKQPTSTVPPGQYTQMGGQGYRYQPRPVQMPNLSKLGLGGGMGLTGATVDANTGETKLNIGELPETKSQREVKETQEKENLKVTGGIKRALKGFADIQKQFNEALPTQAGNEVKTRIAGMAALFGAKTGLKPNAKLLALNKNSRLFLRPIMRGLGEGARMSDQDIQQAIASTEMGGLSPEERQAIVTSFASFAISQMDENALEYLRKDKNAVSLLDLIGIKIGGETNPKLNSLKSKYGLQ